MAGEGQGLGACNLRGPLIGGGVLQGEAVQKAQDSSALEPSLLGLVL